LDGDAGVWFARHRTRGDDWTGEFENFDHPDRILVWLNSSDNSLLVKELHRL